METLESNVDHVFVKTAPESLATPQFLAVRTVCLFVCLSEASTVPSERHIWRELGILVGNLRIPPSLDFARTKVSPEQRLRQNTRFARMNISPEHKFRQNKGFARTKVPPEHKFRQNKSLARTKVSRGRGGDQISQSIINWVIARLGRSQTHIWGCSGAVLGCSGTLLGPFWGCSGAVLGVFWQYFCCFPMTQLVNVPVTTALP